MINNAEEGVQFVLGETTALGLMVKALIESHPNPDVLRRVVEDFKRRADQAMKESPPPNLQLFRYEQLLDEMVSHIRDGEPK